MTSSVGVGLRIGRAVAVTVGVGALSTRVGATAAGVDVGGAVGEGDGAGSSVAVGTGLSVSGVGAAHPVTTPISSVAAQKTHTRRRSAPHRTATTLIEPFFPSAPTSQPEATLPSRRVRCSAAPADREIDQV
jgi:hypothetical protein